ncbi:MAG: DUF4129 domain-containing protein [Gemmatimonadales bacterium]
MGPHAITADSLRTVLDSVFANAAYAWHVIPARAAPGWLRWLRDAIAWVVGLWRRLMGHGGAGMSALPWVLIGIGVLLLVHGMFRVAASARVAHDAALGHSASPGLRHDDAWFRQRADALAAEGRFAEAMVAAFHGVMWRLDQRGMVTHHPSRTPRELAQDAKVGASEGRTLSLVVGQLYAAAFGGLPIGPAQYTDWLATLDHLRDAPAH